MSEGTRREEEVRAAYLDSFHVDRKASCAPSICSVISSYDARAFFISLSSHSASHKPKRKSMTISAVPSAYGTRM